ncbi:hypothetical protein DY000_02039384 [Brassica cretica]|uniref:Uncharacterized protein n=1 Tax=Brassica cretica TaxID=69181 RepID=A0ABQ7BQ25_BRACR|nr:hypothetical protein DY000_02039384 [Brassica cretica]
MCGVRKIRILTKEVALMVPGLQTEATTALSLTRSQQLMAPPYLHASNIQCISKTYKVLMMMVPGFEDESITSTIPPPPEIEAPSLRSPPPPL